MAGRCDFCDHRSQAGLPQLTGLAPWQVRGLRKERFLSDTGTSEEFQLFHTAGVVHGGARSTGGPAPQMPWIRPLWPFGPPTPEPPDQLAERSSNFFPPL